MDRDGTRSHLFAELLHVKASWIFLALIPLINDKDKELFQD